MTWLIICVYPGIQANDLRPMIYMIYIAMCQSGEILILAMCDMYCNVRITAVNMKWVGQNVMLYAWQLLSQLSKRAENWCSTLTKKTQVPIYDSIICQSGILKWQINDRLIICGLARPGICIVYLQAILACFCKYAITCLLGLLSWL